mgnify:CR=1 FL=1
MQRAVGWCEADSAKQRRALWSSVTREVDASASINEGGTAEDFKAFVPCCIARRRELLRKTMSHAEAVMCLHIGQHLFGECIDMSNGACVRSYEWGECGSFVEAEQSVLRLLRPRSVKKLFCKEELKWQ